MLILTAKMVCWGSDHDPHKQGAWHEVSGLKETRSPLVHPKSFSNLLLPSCLPPSFSPTASHRSQNSSFPRWVMDTRAPVSQKPAMRPRHTTRTLPAFLGRRWPCPPCLTVGRKTLAPGVLPHPWGRKHCTERPRGICTAGLTSLPTVHPHRHPLPSDTCPHGCPFSTDSKPRNHPPWVSESPLLMAPCHLKL